MAFTRDPDSVKPYFIDWTNELNSTEGISTSAWSITSAATDITIISNSNTSVKSKVIVSGGTADTDYSLLNHIVADTTTHEEDKTIWLHVRAR